MDGNTAERTVGGLVLEKAYRSRLFEKLGIDYCCKGGVTLSKACADLGLDLEAVLQGIEALDTERTGDAASEPWRGSVDALVDHIVRVHHGYMRESLPRLAFLSEKVARVHGPEDPRLVRLVEAFRRFRAETDEHLAKEEMILFPICIQLARGQRPSFPPTVAMPIRKMVAQHEDHGRNLDLFRELTDGYVPPTHACNTYRALLDGLQDMEQDLHRHIHLENHLLFPWAERLERELGVDQEAMAGLSCPGTK